MDKIVKVHSMLTKWLALYVCGALVLIATGYVATHVVGRYVFNHPIEGTYEWVGISLVPITYLALAYGWSKKGTFVAARFLLVRMKGKIRQATEIFIQLCTLLIFAGLLGYGSLVGFTGTFWAYEHKEVYGTFGGFVIITWPFKVAVVFGFLLMAISIILNIIMLCRGQGLEEEDLTSKI